MLIRVINNRVRIKLTDKTIKSYRPTHFNFLLQGAAWIQLFTNGVGSEVGETLGYLIQTDNARWMGAVEQL